MFEILNSDVYPYIDSYPIGTTDITGLVPGDWVYPATATGTVDTGTAPAAMGTAHLSVPVHVEGDRPDVSAALRLDIYRGHGYRFRTDNYDGAAYNAQDELVLVDDGSGRLELGAVPAGAGTYYVVAVVLAVNAASAEYVTAIKVPPYAVVVV